MIASPLAKAIAASFGSEPRAARHLAGGDINDAFAIELADGRSIFVKSHANAPEGFFEAEARGLGWLAEAGCLATPKVLACSSHPAFLALELMQGGRRVSDFDDRLGRGLAALHRFGAPSFGLDHDNFIGRLPQSNRAHDDWPTFYGQERLLPQIEMAARRGLLAGSLRRRLDALLDRLEELCGPSEPPSRLHGDLWGGNLHRTADGLPALIDPAVYGGHREVDLAMMRLFGGFSSRVFSAYAEAWPLAKGAEERVPLYQLYPVLVHVNLFGGGYVSQVSGLVSTLGF